MNKKLLILSILLLNFKVTLSAEGYYEHKEDRQFVMDVEAIEAQMAAQEAARLEAAIEETKEAAKSKAAVRESQGLGCLYKCPYCPVDYSGKTSASIRYGKHIKKNHPGKKIKYVCPKCLKHFSRAKLLMDHIKSH